MGFGEPLFLGHSTIKAFHLIAVKLYMECVNHICSCLTGLTEAQKSRRMP
jgi:hypothetical protein